MSLCGCKLALVGGVRLRVCRLGSAGCSMWKCAGGERCVDFGDTKKRARNQPEMVGKPK